MGAYFQAPRCRTRTVTDGNTPCSLIFDFYFEGFRKLHRGGGIDVIHPYTVMVEDAGVGAVKSSRVVDYDLSALAGVYICR